MYETLCTTTGACAYKPIISSEGDQSRCPPTDRSNQYSALEIEMPAQVKQRRIQRTDRPCHHGVTQVLQEPNGNPTLHSLVDDVMGNAIGARKLIQVYFAHSHQDLPLTVFCRISKISWPSLQLPGIVQDKGNHCR